MSSDKTYMHNLSFGNTLHCLTVSIVCEFMRCIHAKSDRGKYSTKNMYV